MTSFRNAEVIRLLKSNNTGCQVQDFKSEAKPKHILWKVNNRVRYLPCPVKKKSAAKSLNDFQLLRLFSKAQQSIVNINLTISKTPRCNDYCHCISL
jgi:hypothetical protein